MRTRAAILHDMGQQWSVEEFELDPPKAGEVLLEMAAAGLCHSDEHIRNGDMSASNEVMQSYGLPSMFPLIGGHEGAGVVLEVGDGVTAFEPGDHVVTSFVAVCGRCRWCNSGMEYICDMGAQVMIPGMPTDGTFRHHTTDGRNLGHLSKVGAFSKHTVVSPDSIVKIDPHLPLLPMALLSCGIPTGYGSAENRAKVRSGDTVVVIGVGGIGTGAIQGARINGAAQIIAVDPVEFKQKSALGFGATHSVASTEEAADLVRDLTSGVMADSVIVSPSLITEQDVQAGAEPDAQGRNVRTDRDDEADDEFHRDQPAGVHPVEQEPRRHGFRIVQSAGGHPPVHQALRNRAAAARRDDHQALPARRDQRRLPRPAKR